MDQVIIGKVNRNSVIISLKDHGKRNFPFFKGCGGLNLRMCKFYNSPKKCTRTNQVEHAQIWLSTFLA